MRRECAANVWPIHTICHPFRFFNQIDGCPFNFPPIYDTLGTAAFRICLAFA